MVYPISSWICPANVGEESVCQIFFLIITMLGTSMVIGDGVLTPSISVLFAVSGIKQATPTMTEGRIVWISIAILVCLFMVQRFGTDKVGYSFAPIICVWFAFIGGIGVYNFIKFDPSVIKAINPKYIVDYFQRNKKDAWVSLGGVVLATTGTEALFADVGYFTVRSIQISMCAVTYPALRLAYTGQASFLREHEEPFVLANVCGGCGGCNYSKSSNDFRDFFYDPAVTLVGVFSSCQNCSHISQYEGQVYIPEVNYLLMLACIGVTIGFRTTEKIGNAYGIAVVFVMTLTSSLLVLIMIMIWKTNVLFIIAYVFIIGSVELVYLSSVLYKFDQGGYLPLVFAASLMTVMYVWNSVHRRKYNFELDHEISPERLKEIAANTNLCRIPGLALFYSELVHGIPPIFEHYVTNVPALHSVLVFVSIKSLPISKVPAEERFLFRRMEPKELNVFRCVVRYGYTDIHNEQDQSFEWTLVEGLKEFIKDNVLLSHILVTNGKTANREAGQGKINGRQVEEDWQATVEREISILDAACKAGVVHLIGESEVIASEGAGIGKRILIDYAYNFLKKNLRQSEKVFDIPHRRMLKVGMTYEL